jgi:excisionase family DNA binding protein
MNAERLLNIAEVVELTRISRSGIYGLIARGELRSVKFRGRRRVRAADLNAWIRQLAGVPEPDRPTREELAAALLTLADEDNVDLYPPQTQDAIRGARAMLAGTESGAPGATHGGQVTPGALGG